MRNNYTISDVKSVLDIQKSDITFYLKTFKEYFSEKAIPPAEKKRYFTIDEICKLKLIHFYWEGEDTDIGGIKSGLNSEDFTKYPFNQPYFALTPIIRTDFENVTDPKSFGLIASYNYEDDFELAKAFKKTAVLLIDRAIKSPESWTYVYPIMFNLRHAIELFLKSIILKEMKNTHALDKIFSQLKKETTINFGLQFELLIQTIDELDKKGTAYRYTQEFKEDEHYLDFHLAKDTLVKFEDAIELIRLNINDYRR